VFDQLDSVVGLLPGESDEDLIAENELAYAQTTSAMREGDVEPERQILPDDLESILPGPYLAAIVGSVDRARLNGHDAVRLMQAESRLETAYAAHKMSSVSEVAHCPPGDADAPVERDPDEVEYSAVEVAAALTLTRRAAESLMDHALWLSSDGRRVLRDMLCGRLTVAKTRELERHLWHLDHETVDSVLDTILPEAPSLTTGQLRHRLGRQVMIEDPDGAKSCMEQGLAERKVSSHANPDFTGCLHICSGHPLEVRAAARHIDRVARSLKALGDDRGLDQLRTDVALDLLQGKTVDVVVPGRGGLHASVPLETLAGLANLPGDLGGYGPVIADIARQLALELVDGEWTWSVTHRGDVIATGTTSYRPTISQRRRARAEYTTCVAPGCRMPATQCDLDHREPFSRGGRTHNKNLAPLCRHHHMMRHHTPWRYRRLPDGEHIWTSPLSHTYVRPRDPPG
jgi:hypothetical protein